MRLSRLLFAAVVAAAPTTARADDTADFLKPSNWEGREDLWTVKGNTIVGETKEWLIKQSKSSAAYRAYLERWGDWVNPKGK